MYWSEYLDEFGCTLLERLGENPRSLPTDRNPIIDAINEGDFVEKYGEMNGFNRMAVVRAAVLCQMTVFDECGGPEEDRKPKAARRHWYSYFKTKLSQPFALQLGDFEVNAQGVKEIDDRAWGARQSKAYGELVDTGQITYKDLWVNDASRMWTKIHETLFRGCNILICVEKDSLFDDFKAPANSLGATAVYSGKGKSSKAAIEKTLREAFGWGGWQNPFEKADEPLIILHISDYDYDGERVIGPTFGNQATRYTDNIREARVGIEPQNVTECGYQWDDRWYQVKVSNKGYQDWAEKKALFLARCEECGREWPVLGIEADAGYYGEHECPECGSKSAAIEVGLDTAHGFEVEALKTRDYYGLIVDALLQVLDFDYIVGKLRDECKADAYDAAGKIARSVYSDNESYQALLKEFERLEKVKKDFESKVHERLQDLGNPHIEDWRDEDDDPTPDDYREHVQETRYGPWRPFDTADRTAKLVEFLQEEHEDVIDEFAAEVIWTENGDE